jgi:preprotein translocase subunit SecY
MKYVFAHAKIAWAFFDMLLSIVERKANLEILSRLKRDKETRNKLLIVTMVLFALLIGYRIPLPGINLEYIKLLFANLNQSGVGGFINSATGSAFSNMSIFALSISPYITASIIMQLLSVVIPSLERMASDGSVGKQKMEKLTFALGVIVAIIEALALAIGLGRKGLFVNYSWYTVVYTTVIWTVGACFLMWVSQIITNKLIGNGTSLILMFNMLTTFPGDIVNIFSSIAGKAQLWMKIIVCLSIAIILFLAFAYVVLLHNAEKRMRITNSGKLGLRMSGADENIMPIKLNFGGIMPVIFASSIISIPALISQAFTIKPGSVWEVIIKCFSQNYWFKKDSPIYTIGVILFVLLIYAFSYIYSIMSFNTNDIADNLRKNGSVLNGLRPGQPTADYLNKQIKGMRWIGTTMTVAIVLLPMIISGIFNIDGMRIGGTTIIIIVNVILELRNSIMARTSAVAYKSLIKNSRRKRK